MEWGCGVPWLGILRFRCCRLWFKGGGILRLAAIIVNYRTAALTADCLRSISAGGWLPGKGRVVVVDNASGDDSVVSISRTVASQGWGKWVDLVPAERNGGFAYGNNVGIGRVMAGEDRPEYVLLLNPDTVVRPGAIETLVRFMDEHLRVGICGGRLLDANHTPQCSGFCFPSVLGELESGARLGAVTRLLRWWVVPMPLSEVPTRVDWVSGACFLIRREVLEQIGLLDEAFFMYYEEVDYCRRARAAGWEVWHVPQAEIVHLEGAASGVRERGKPRPRYWYNSRRWYFTKNHGRLYAVAAEMAFLIGYIFWRARRMLQRKPDLDPRTRVFHGCRHIVLPALVGK